MGIYWLMYLVPLTAPGILRLMKLNASKLGVWVLVGVLFALIIGFRDHIGCDWYAYMDHYDTIKSLPFWEGLTETDPAYAALNWVSAQLGFGIFGVNLICGIIAMTGIIAFCRAQPLPWVAFAVAIPYLITVVVMGYSREGVAIGLVLWGLSVLRAGNVTKYIGLILLAGLFHKTAVVMMPLSLIHARLKLKTKIFVLVPLVALSIYALLAASYNSLMENYVTAQMSSDGGMTRVMMNAIPGLLFLLVYKKWKQCWEDTQIWLFLAGIAIVSVPLDKMASTATDRMGLYLIPLQMMFYSRLPLLIKDRLIRGTVTLAIMIGYALILYIWLTRSYYASSCWVPYKNVLVN